MGASVEAAFRRGLAFGRPGASPAQSQFLRSKRMLQLPFLRLLIRVFSFEFPSIQLALNVAERLSHI